eukprot:1173871-Prorocentrum_minimum.AAC.2
MSGHVVEPVVGCTLAAVWSGVPFFYTVPDMVRCAWSPVGTRTGIRPSLRRPGRSFARDTCMHTYRAVRPRGADIHTCVYYT